MADISKRAKKARKTAGKRAKHARKAAGKTSTRTRAQAAAGLAVFLAAAAAVKKLLGSGGSGGSEQRYTPEPDNLPNTPDRPAATTPVPGAA